MWHYVHNFLIWPLCTCICIHCRIPYLYRSFSAKVTYRLPIDIDDVTLCTPLFDVTLCNVSVSAAGFIIAHHVHKMPYIHGERERERERERDKVIRHIWRDIMYTNFWCDIVRMHLVLLRGGGLGSSTIFKNLMSPTPRRKWYLTMRRRAH